MKIGFNNLTASYFSTSVSEKGKNVFSQLDRKICIVAAILFAVLITIALIYQSFKRDNGETIRKSTDLPKMADLPEETDLPRGTDLPKVADLPEEIDLPEKAEQTLELTSGETHAFIQDPVSDDVFDEEIPPFLDDKKNEQEKAVAINLTPTASDEACESLELQKETNGFPTPFETIKKMSWYNPTDVDSIIEKVDQALRSPQGERVPSEYAKLQNLIGSDEQLELLYREAKVLAHRYSVQDLENDGYDSEEREFKRQYPIILFANLSTLVSGLCKHKQFHYSGPQKLDRIF